MSSSRTGNFLGSAAAGAESSTAAKSTACTARLAGSDAQPCIQTWCWTSYRQREYEVSPDNDRAWGRQLMLCNRVMGGPRGRAAVHLAEHVLLPLDLYCTCRTKLKSENLRDLKGGLREI